MAYVQMIVLLTVTALVAPQFVSSGTESYLPEQAVIVILMTVVVYAAFLFFQMTSYRRMYVQPAQGAMAVPVGAETGSEKAEEAGPLDKRAMVIRSIVLIALILPIVLLAHDLAVLIDLGIRYAGAPVAVGGMLIAIIVFTPESLTAVRAALNNEMQRAVNLCLGAFVSTVGLTIPAILTIGLMTGKTVTLAIGELDTVLLVATILLTAFTFGGQRTSPMQGVMHLALFVVYAMLLFVP